jgi:uncharacterized protein (TIGR00266 family)
MKFELLDRPDFGYLRVRFDGGGEQITAESGAMVSMSSTLQMKTQARGGILAAAKRSVLGGESFFQNTFTSTAAGEELMLASGMEGDLREHRLDVGETLFVTGGNYLAHVGERLTLDTKFAGVKGLFSGTGLFLLKIGGPGTVFFNAYGALHEVTPGPQGYVVDTDHVVAFTDGLDYELRRFNGTKGLLLSGEGFVCHFKGQGRLWLQTRNPRSLSRFLDAYRPVERSDSGS